MSKLPLPTVIDTNVPMSEIKDKEKPTESKVIDNKPDATPKINSTPQETEQKTDTPVETPEKEEKPSDIPGENCVKIGNKIIEIKPTKLKYFRNKAASAYGIIKVLPIHEFMTYDAGVLDEKRSADALLYDFLVAAFDDPVVVRDNYNDIDADTIERIVKIFGRLNHIDEKEENIRKNKEAQAKR